MRLSLLTLFFAAAVARAADDYPRPDLLVEPAALAAADPKPVVLDARPEAEYHKGHAPGAVWLDAAAWAKAFGDGDDAAGWSKRVGGLGVTATTPVVVYDASRSKDAARIWWILQYWGVRDVRVLNGGWRGWQAAKLPTEAEAVRPTPAEFRATAAPARLATKAELLESLKTPGLLQIVDARSEKEFCGTEAMGNAKAGAIPGAKHLEWADLIDAETHRFKPPATLRKLFTAAGIRLDTPTATHCQGGGRAAVMAFGLELMGATGVSNYHRSFGEWGNAPDTPVVKPPAKQ